MRISVSSIVAFASVLGCAGMAAVGDANPYAVVWERNIFHLNPEPPPPAAPTPKPPELPKVMLTGFVGKGHTMKILLAVVPKDPKEATAYLCLEPGQKEHNVELVNIHAQKQEVEIINSGTPETLSVESNSYAAAAIAPAPAPRAQAGVHRMPGMPPMIGFRHQPGG